MKRLLTACILALGVAGCGSVTVDLTVQNHLKHSIVVEPLVKVQTGTAWYGPTYEDVHVGPTPPGGQLEVKFDVDRGMEFQIWIANSQYGARTVGSKDPDPLVLEADVVEGQNGPPLAVYMSAKDKP